MSDKIRISLDDVNSAEVDHKLQQQSAVSRATEHYHQQVAPSMPSISGNGSGTNLWYNTLVYMTLFGLVGGALAWPAAEIVWQATIGAHEAVERFLVEHDRIEQRFSAGELSRAEAEALVDRLAQQYRGNEIVQVIMDDSLSESEQEQRLQRHLDNLPKAEFIAMIFFCALGGMSIAIFFSIAEAVVSKNIREAVINGSVGLCLGLLGGILVGLFVDKIYQALGGGSGQTGMATQVLARAVGWGVLGLFLAIAPGIVMKSSKKLLIGLAGGFLGGLVGGLLFDLVAGTTGAAWLSRLIALVSIGIVAGLSTGLIENAAKTGWLKVVGGLIAGKQFILYKNPTYLGSSPQCEIYLFKDIQVAPQHAAIRQTPQGYEIQDLGTSSGTFVNGAPVSRVRLTGARG